MYSYLSYSTSSNMSSTKESSTYSPWDDLFHYFNKKAKSRDWSQRRLLSNLQQSLYNNNFYVQVNQEWIHAQDVVVELCDLRILNQTLNQHSEDLKIRNAALSAEMHTTMEEIRRISSILEQTPSKADKAIDVHPCYQHISLQTSAAVSNSWVQTKTCDDPEVIQLKQEKEEVVAELVREKSWRNMLSSTLDETKEELEVFRASKPMSHKASQCDVSSTDQAVQFKLEVSDASIQTKESSSSPVIDLDSCLSISDADALNDVPVIRAPTESRTDTSLTSSVSKASCQMDMDLLYSEDSLMDLEEILPKGHSSFLIGTTADVQRSSEDTYEIDINGKLMHIKEVVNYINSIASEKENLTALVDSLNHQNNQLSSQVLSLMEDIRHLSISNDSLQAKVRPPCDEAAVQTSQPCVEAAIQASPSVSCISVQTKPEDHADNWLAQSPSFQQHGSSFEVRTNSSTQEVPHQEMDQSFDSLSLRTCMETDVDLEMDMDAPQATPNLETTNETAAGTPVERTERGPRVLSREESESGVANSLLDLAHDFEEVINSQEVETVKDSIAVEQSMLPALPRPRYVMYDGYPNNSVSTNLELITTNTMPVEQVGLICQETKPSLSTEEPGTIYTENRDHISYDENPGMLTNSIEPRESPGPHPPLTRRVFSGTFWRTDLKRKTTCRQKTKKVYKGNPGHKQRMKDQYQSMTSHDIQPTGWSDSPPAKFDGFNSKPEYYQYCVRFMKSWFADLKCQHLG